MRAFVTRIVTTLAAGAIALSSVLPAAAQSRVALVRDAEAEALIRDYARPILGAAGLDKASVQIKIVNDRTFNAFVADSRHIFINTGTVIQSETPGELIGVIAHETGHLAAGHLIRLREAVRRAQILSAIAMIGGAAAAIAGGSGSAAGAAAAGGSQIGRRSLLAYQREEETNADRAAITYLNATKQSGAGMLRTFERLADDMLFVASSGDPYAFSHPLPAERLSTLAELVRSSPYYDVPDKPELQRRHDLVRAKFVAFTGSQQAVQRAYPASDSELPASYARAILAWRFGDPRGAAKLVDGLIAEQPKNPYFWELKGQILLEGGSPREAIEPLKTAVALAPKEGLIRVMYGHALVATEDPKLLEQAVKELNRGLGDDPDQSIGYSQLAIAYARLGNVPMADLATAQGAFAAGDVQAAKQYAQRAQAKLKTGTPAWLRADDIVSYKPPSY
jgi:predicted Zn-dependent protease